MRAEHSKADRPPLAWMVGAVTCWVLTVVSLAAAAMGAGVALIALGVPGAIGLIALGLWMRRRRLQSPS